jgi:hypothetical protein
MKKRLKSIQEEIILVNLELTKAIINDELQLIIYFQKKLDRLITDYLTCLASI